MHEPDAPRAEPPDPSASSDATPPGDRTDRSIHRRLTVALQLVLLAGLALAIVGGQWLNALTTGGVLVVTLLPVLLGRRFRVFIPPEFEVMTVLFVFASLFLGEVRGYSARFWWWDTALHTASGFLLGILGFLLVYVLNEKEDVAVEMNPGFVALFAFLFAVGMGALWEIFEFAMDSFFSMNMQKPMLGDLSGLTDTMWDLIVDTLGAAVIAVMGYGYLQAAGKTSFLEQWIQRFVEVNPRLFGGAGS